MRRAIGWVLVLVLVVLFYFVFEELRREVERSAREGALLSSVLVTGAAARYGRMQS
jgi:hypothetical protein